VAVLKALVARGAVVRALVRSNSHRAALDAIGVHDIVAGEMEDPRAWSQAVGGTNAVYHICPNMSPYELPFARALVAGRRHPRYRSSCLSLGAASADRGDAASLGQAAGRGDAVQLPARRHHPAGHRLYAEFARRLTREAANRSGGSAARSS